ncbi:MAG: hypothetical protein Q7K25_09995 [Actinomycetota bacterium]|nr:hypothetical protein [Actinomycetota bacterium]
MKLPVVPFLTPPHEAISHGDWLLTTAGGDVALAKEVPHWDYQTTLELAAPVSVDRQAVTDACQLERTSGLAVVVMARSNHTNVERVAARLDLPMNDAFDLAVQIRLDGAELGGRLTLETLLVVTEPKPQSHLAPQRPGSIIWRRSTWTDLEGSGTQFPTDTMDFMTAGLDPNAGWQLKIDLSDPDARFMSATRLTLNSAHPSVVRMLGGVRDDGTEQLLRTLNWDITRQMVQVAIASDDVCQMDMDPDGTSVAAVLRNLLSRIWPTESTIVLRRWLEHDPGRIEVRLQHFSRLLK